MQWRTACLHGTDSGCWIQELPFTRMYCFLRSVSDFYFYIGEKNNILIAVVVQSSSHVRLFATPWTAACRPPCPSSSPGVCPSSCSLHQWCCPAISFSDALFSCPPSFPASGTFPMNCLFTSDDQNTGASASASVLPGNIQSWSHLRLTGLISLLSEGLSGVFSSTTVQRH